MLVLRVTILLAVTAAAGVLHAGLQDGDSGQAKPPALVRYEAVRLLWDQAEVQRKRGRDATIGDGSEESIVLWSRRLAEAASAAGVQSAHDAYGEHCARMERRVEGMEPEFKRSLVSRTELARARYFAADARVLLETVSR